MLCREPPANVLSLLLSPTDTEQPALRASLVDFNARDCAHRSIGCWGSLPLVHFDLHPLITGQHGHMSFFHSSVSSESIGSKYYSGLSLRHNVLRNQSSREWNKKYTISTSHSPMGDIRTTSYRPLGSTWLNCMVCGTTHHCYFRVARVVLRVPTRMPRETVSEGGVWLLIVLPTLGFRYVIRCSCGTMLRRVYRDE